MANTPNYNLYKPNRADDVEVDTSLSTNFTTIDTELKANKDGLDAHKNDALAHTSEKISHADGSVKTILDNHEDRLGNLETDTEGIEERVTNIETLGLDQLAPNLEGRIQTIESDVEGILAPATFDAMDQQSYTFDEYRIGYVDNRLKEWVDVSKFGYDLAAVNAAVATLKEGDTLYFPNAVAPYQLLGAAINITVPNITVRGNGLIQAEYGFRPKASGFTADGLRMEATRYHTDARAIYVMEPADGTFIRDFNVRNCKFKNFFYAADFRGGSYDVTGNEAAEGYPVRDVTIFNNYSETYTDMGGGDGVEKNAGHFNCTQVENISYIDNRTYGGRNATSYNLIKGNGFIRVTGNYDENNTYGSCELENLASLAVVANNTFKKQLWVDDSSSVIIANNTVSDDIFVSVEKYGVDNILITNNICARVKLDTFGANYVAGKLIDNVTISGNKFINGASKSYGVYINGAYASKVTVDSNDFPASYSSGKIGGIRSTTLNLTLRNNDVNGNVVVSGTGGKITSTGNIGATFTSTGSDDGETTNALPTASVSLRGKMILLRSAPGVADLMYVCKKQANDTYAWVQIG